MTIKPLKKIIAATAIPEVRTVTTVEAGIVWPTTANIVSLIAPKDIVSLITKKSIFAFSRTQNIVSAPTVE